MAKILWDVLSEYQILTKLGYFTMDNASNNDAMLLALECRLQEEGIEWDSTNHRLRNGHIIQLAVGAFLFGRHPNLSDSDDLTREDIAQWRHWVLLKIAQYRCLGPTQSSANAGFQERQWWQTQMSMSKLSELSHWLAQPIERRPAARSARSDWLKQGCQLARLDGLSPD
ncbi:hypothetical protein A1F94_013918 [Pyrenophora tritici-repentis]|nr:hypothetical protein A1F94_013918 [Pyrenophora tritici-repentis]